MKKHEAYSILEVTKDSSSDEIKKAFRKKAGLAHPDKNPGDKTAEEKFKRINEAHQILTGVAKAEDDVPQYSQVHNQTVDDIFRSHFGGFSGFAGFGGDPFPNAKMYQKRENIVLGMQISFTESVLGCEKDIEFKKNIYCKLCDGKKYEAKHRMVCKHCEGLGQVEQRINQGFVSQVYRGPCAACAGTGETGTACTACGGKGHSLKLQKMKLKIPAIGEHKTNLVVKNGGHEYLGGITDLMVEVTPTISSQTMMIKGNNVLSKKAVPLDILLFGGELKVRLVDCEHTISIPENSKIGSVFCVRERGVRAGKHKENGHHLIELEMLYPTNITEDLKLALINAYQRKEMNHGQTKIDSGSSSGISDGSNYSSGESSKGSEVKETSGT